MYVDKKNIGMKKFFQNVEKKNTFTQPKQPNLNPYKMLI